jgi:hypothetical protein
VPINEELKHQEIMYSTNPATNPATAAVNKNTSNMHPSTLNLDDIFGDVLFTPDGDTVCTFSW